MMKERAMSGLVLLLVLIGGALQAQEAKGPRIEVKQERYDLGGIAQGEPAVHVFEVRNAGSEPLVIESLQPS